MASLSAPRWKLLVALVIGAASAVFFIVLSSTASVKLLRFSDGTRDSSAGLTTVEHKDGDDMFGTDTGRRMLAGPPSLPKVTPRPTLPKVTATPTLPKVTSTPTRKPTNRPTPQPTVSRIIVNTTEQLSAALYGTAEVIEIGVSNFIVNSLLVVSKRRSVTITGSTPFTRITMNMTQILVYGDVVFQNVDFYYAKMFIQYGFPKGRPIFTNCTFHLSPSCDSGWVSTSPGSCLKMMTQPLDWDDAFRSCRAIGADLMAIHSVTDFLATPYDVSSWIGGRIGFSHFQQFTKLGWQPLNQGFEWCDSSDNTWLAIFSPLLRLDDFLQCISSRYYGLAPADCQKKKPFICAKPRRSAQVTADDDRAVWTNARFVVNDYLEVQDALASGSLPNSGVLIGGRAQVSTRFPNVIQLALQSSNSTSSVIASFDTSRLPGAPGQFSFRNLLGIPSLVHLHSSVPVCVSSFTLLFDGKVAGYFNASEFLTCDLPRDIYSFGQNCIRIYRDLTLDFTKDSCDAVRLLWRNPLVGEDFAMTVKQNGRVVSPVSLSHRGTLGERDFTVGLQGKLSLDDLLDVRTLPDVVNVSSRLACVSSIAITRYGSTIRSADLAAAYNCSNVCGEFSTEQCMWFDQASFLSSALVNLTSHVQNPIPCTGVINYVQHDGPSVHSCVINVTVHNFTELQQIANKLTTHEYKSVDALLLVDTIPFTAALQIPADASLMLRSNVSTQLIGATFVLASRARFSLSDIVFGNGVITVKDSTPVIDVVNCVFDGYVRIGNTSHSTGNNNTIYISSADQLDSAVHNGFLQDGGLIFVNQTIQMQKVLTFLSMARMRLQGPFNSSVNELVNLQNFTLRLSPGAAITFNELGFNSNATFVVDKGANLTLLQVQVTYASVPTISGAGNVDIEACIFDDDGQQGESLCRLANMPLGTLAISSSTFDGRVDVSCVPSDFLASENVLRIPNFQQLMAAIANPMALMDEGHLMYFQVDGGLHLIPVVNASVQVVVETADNSSQLDVAYDAQQNLVRLLGLVDTCVTAVKLMRGGSSILDISSSLFATCPGVCLIDSAVPCTFLPAYFYSAEQSCIYLTAQRGLDITLDLDALFCDRLIPGNVTVQVQAGSSPYVVFVNGDQVQVGQSLPRKTALSQVKVVATDASSGMCFSSIQLLQNGIPLVTETAAAYRQCSNTCSRIFDQTTGCVMASSFGLALGTTADCSRFLVNSIISCEEDMIGLTLEALSDLNANVITTLKASLLSNTSQSFSQAIVLGGGQTLRLASLPVVESNPLNETDPSIPANVSSSASLEANFIVHPGAQLTIQDLTLLGRIINLGGSVELENVVFGPALTISPMALLEFVDGGAILNSKNSILTASNVNFLSHHAARDGGAVANIDNSQAYLLGCYFGGNQAEGRGNSIFNAAGSSVQILDCTFADPFALFNEAGGIMVLTNPQVLGAFPLFADNSSGAIGDDSVNHLMVNSDLQSEVCMDDPPFETAFNATLTECQQQCKEDAQCTALSYEYVLQECSLCLGGACRFQCTNTTTLYEASPVYRFFPVVDGNLCFLNATQVAIPIAPSSAQAVPSLQECKSWCGFYNQQCNMFTFDSERQVCSLYNSVVLETECGGLAGISSSVYLAYGLQPIRYTFVGLGSFQIAEDFLAEFTNISLAVQCESMCIVHRRCRGFAYSPGKCNLYASIGFTNDEHGGEPQAVYIDTIGDAFPKYIYDSGFATLSPIAMANIASQTDVQVVTALSTGHCQRLCDGSSFCNAFAFTNITFQCLLLPSIPGQFLVASLSEPSLHIGYERENFQTISSPSSENDTTFVFEACQVVTSIGLDNVKLAPSQCKSVCYAHDACDLVLYDFSRASCAMFASRCIAAPVLAYELNTTYQELWNLTRSLAVSAYHRGAGCLRTNPLLSVISPVSNSVSCERLCDLFGTDCVGTTFENGRCQLWNGLFVLDPSLCNDATTPFSIALNSIQNPNNFLALPQQYCLTAITLALLPLADEAQCASTCLGAPILCLAYTYSPSTGCQLFQGVDFDVCAQPRPVTTRSFLVYSDVVFAEPQPEDVPSQIVAVDDGVASVSNCIALCAAYEDCHAVVYNGTGAGCQLRTACGMDTLACLASQTRLDFFLPQACPIFDKNTTVSETVPALRLEHCMALCDGRSTCRGLLFGIDLSCQLLLGDVTLSASDTTSCDVRSFYLKGTSVPLVPYRTLPETVCPTTFNATYTVGSADACYVHFCTPGCVAFMFDPVLSLCSVSVSPSLGFCTAAELNSHVASFLVSNFDYTVSSGVALKDPQVIRRVNGMSDTGQCSILCGATPSCQSFALDTTDLSACVLFETVPAILPGILGDIELYTKFAQHNLTSLGTSGKSLSASPASGVRLAITDLDMCLRICDLLTGCQAVVADPCTFFASADYTLNASVLSSSPEIWISFTSQTQYNSQNTKFVTLSNVGFAGLPSENANWQTTFNATGNSRLVFLDGTIHPFLVDLTLTSLTGDIQLVNACMKECNEQSSTKILTGHPPPIYNQQNPVAGYNCVPNGQVWTTCSFHSGCYYKQCSGQCVFVTIGIYYPSQEYCCKSSDPRLNHVISHNYYTCTPLPTYLSTEQVVVYRHATDSCSPAVSNAPIVTVNPDSQSCATPAPVQFTPGSVLPVTTSLNLYGIGPGKTIQIMVSLKNSYSWFAQSPWVYTGDYKELYSTASTAAPPIRSAPINGLCLSSVTPNLSPPASGQDGQMWQYGTSDAPPVSFRNMQFCTSPAATATQLSMYLTFQIFSVTAPGQCITLLSLSPLSVVLQQCSDALNQQWYLDNSNSLVSATTPGQGVFTGIKWTSDGYLRRPLSGTALVFPFSSASIKEVSCAAANNSCPMRAHQRFVLPKGYPARLATLIRDAPQLEGPITFLPGFGLGAVSSKANVSSLAECQQSCTGSCVSVEFDSFRKICLLQNGVSKNILAAKQGSTASVPYIANPYRRVFTNESMDELTFLWMKPVMQTAECYALCDDLSLCRTLTLDANLTCRLYTAIPSSSYDNSSTTVVPQPGSNFTEYESVFENSTEPNADGNLTLRIYNNIRRLPVIPSNFGYSDRDLLVINNMDLDECSVLCLTMEFCRLMKISHDNNGRPTCYLNTRERSQSMQLESLSGGCMGYSQASSPKIFSDPSCNGSMEVQYYFDGLYIRSSWDPSLCVVRNSTSDEIRFGTCTPDTNNGVELVSAWELDSATLDTFIGPSPGIDPVFDRVLRQLPNQAFGTVNGTNLTDPAFHFRKFGSPTMQYFTKPSALNQNIEDPELLLQLFLLSPQGQQSLSVLNKIQNLERKTAPVVDSLQNAGTSVGNLNDLVDFALTPLGDVSTMISQLDAALKPIVVAVGLAKAFRVVKAALDSTQFNKILDRVSSGFKRTEDVLSDATNRVSALFSPLNNLEGIFLLIAGFLAPFASAELLRKLATLNARAYACAVQQGDDALAAALQDTMTGLETTIQAIEDIVDGIELVIKDVLKIVDALVTAIQEQVIAIAQGFQAALLPVSKFLHEFDFLKNLMDLTVFCAPNASFEWVDHHFVTGTLLGTIDMTLPQISLGGKFCVPMPLICDGGLLDILAIVLRFIPTVGSIISLIVKIIVKVLKAFFKTIPALLALGGDLQYDSKHCAACMKFSDYGGGCLFVGDLDRYIDEAEKIINQIPGVKFMLDELNSLIEGTLKRWMPHVDLNMPSLNFPDLNLFDLQLGALNVHFDKLDVHMANLMNEMDGLFGINATSFVPDGFDLACNLGPEMLARIEYLIGIGPDVDEIGVAAAIVAVQARGRLLPFSPTSVLEGAIATKLAPPYAKTLSSSQMYSMIGRILGTRVRGDLFAGIVSPYSKSPKSGNILNQLKRVIAARKLDTPEPAFLSTGMAIVNQRQPGVGGRLLQNTGAFFDFSFGILLMDTHAFQGVDYKGEKKNYRLMIKVDFPQDSFSCITPDESSSRKEKSFLTFLPGGKLPVNTPIPEVANTAAPLNPLTLSFTVAYIPASSPSLRTLVNNRCSAAELQRCLQIAPQMQCAVEFTQNPYYNDLDNPPVPNKRARRAGSTSAPPISVNRAMNARKISLDLLKWTCPGAECAHVKGPVLSSRGPYKGAAATNNDLWPKTMLYINRAMDAAFAARNLLDTRFATVQNNEVKLFYKRLFLMAFGYQVQSENILGSWPAGKPFPYTEVQTTPEYDLKLADISARYSKFITKVTTSLANTMEIRTMDPDVAPQVDKGSSNAYAFSRDVFINIKMDSAFLRNSRASYCGTRGGDACVESLLVSTFLHEMTHLWKTNDHFYFYPSSVRPMPQIVSAAQTLGNKLEIYLTKSCGLSNPLLAYCAKSKTSLKEQNKYQAKNADSYAVFAVDSTRTIPQIGPALPGQPSVTGYVYEPVI